MTIMKRDENICRRIMLQFEQKSVFSTTDYTEACHVGLLKDRNYVDADLNLNEEGRVVAAVIHRITANGYDTLDGKVSISNAVEAKAEYRKSLADERYAAQKTFEKTLYLLSSGGITLVAALLNGSNFVSVSNLLFLAVLFWCFDFVLLIIMHGFSIAAFDYQIQGIDEGRLDTVDATNFWSKGVNVLYWIVSFFFTVGLVFFLVGIYKYR